MEGETLITRLEMDDALLRLKIGDRIKTMISHHGKYTGRPYVISTQYRQHLNHLLIGNLLLFIISLPFFLYTPWWVSLFVLLVCVSQTLVFAVIVFRRRKMTYWHSEEEAYHVTTEKLKELTIVYITHAMTELIEQEAVRHIKKHTIKTVCEFSGWRVMTGKSDSECFIGPLQQMEPSDSED